MDIKQQTQNVAAQGRYGDSMLLHVNPAEVKGLASAMPITVNPQTGQPEAFLPFLAPILGSMAGTALLGAGTAAGLSAAAAAGIGAGLATYAQTGGSGSKALLSGLTAGMGTKALGTGAGTATGSSAPIDQSAFESMKDIFTQTPGGSSNTFDLGVKTLAESAMTPSGIVAGVGAGTQGVMASQEQFEREMAQLQLDEEERKRKMYEDYPEQIPIASGGSTSFADGGKTGYRRGQNVYYDPRETNNFNTGSGEYYVPGGRAQTTTRQTRPITPGYMAGFMPEYRYFQGDDPKTYLTRYARDIQDSSSQQPQNTEARPPMSNYGGFRPPMPLQPPFMGGRGYQSYQPRFGGFGGYGGFGNPFMQSPRYQSFYGNPQMGGMFNPYARFNQQPIQPYFAPPPVYTPPPQPPIDTPPPSDGGDLPPTDGPLLPPIDDGIGRKGRTRNVEPISPPNNFVNPIAVGRPAQPPVNTPPPVSTPPVNTPPPTVTIPIEGGRDVTIPDFSKINTPNPRDNFISIGAPVSGIKQPMPVNDGPGSMGRPVAPILGGSDFLPKPGFIGKPDIGPPNRPKPVELPDFGYGPGIRPTEIFNSDGTITGPAGVTPPKRDDFMSIGAPLSNKIGPISGNNEINPNISVGSGFFDNPIIPRMINENPIPFTPPTPAAPGNTPMTPPTGFKPMGGMPMFGPPMFADGGDTDLPNEGLKALAKTEKGREAVEAMGYQEGGPIDMMQDPLTQEVIKFILGESDNEDIIMMFVNKYGTEQFQMLRSTILKQAAGNPDAQTEGLIQGNGNSGMADDLPMNIGKFADAAVSQDEYIIPADVVSMLGDGSSDAGSKQLDGMLDRVRMAKTGGKTQAAPLNPEEVMPA